MFQEITQIIKNKLFFLMIPNGQERKAKYKERPWHYLAVKKLSASLRGIKSKSYNCLNCLRSFRTKSKIESRKRVSKN